MELLQNNGWGWRWCLCCIRSLHILQVLQRRGRRLRQCWRSWYDWSSIDGINSWHCNLQYLDCETRILCTRIRSLPRKGKFCRLSLRLNTLSHRYFTKMGFSWGKHWNHFLWSQTFRCNRWILNRNWRTWMWCLFSNHWWSKVHNKA